MADSINKYLNILRGYSKEMYHAAQQTLEDKEENNLIAEISATVTGPILYGYVLWIINEAKIKGIDRLYFLARDGDILRKIAISICEKYNINIECRYLYCSRFALRVPAYHLDIEKAINKICLNGIDITLDKIFDRANITMDEKSEIMDKLNIHDLYHILPKNQLNEIKIKLEQSEYFKKIIYTKSKKQYEVTMDYFQQEGLYDEVEYGIVDSGWTGSMQESLYHLLKSKKEEIKCPYGFYFGLYDIPFGMEPKNYNTYYFSKESGLYRKIMFNNNIFECMCASMDGMTVGFIYTKEKIVPTFSTANNKNSREWGLELQYDTILSFVTNYLKQKDIFDNVIYLMKVTEKLCKSFMIYPSIEEVDKYGAFQFSDDITEKYVIKLAEKRTKQQLVQELLPMKVIYKVMKKSYIEKDTSWNEGTIAKFGGSGKRIYLANLFIVKALRYIRMSL